MKDFTWWNPTIVVFGKNTIPQIADQLSAIKAKSALVVYGGKAIFKNGVYLQATEALTKKGIAFPELGGVRPNPTIDKVREGVARVKASAVDAIVPIGGGSVFDTAKAIAAGAFYDGDPWDLFEGKASEMRRALPIFGVLTASATASEVNSIAVVSNPEREAKTSLNSPFIFPRVSIVDPSVQTSLPEEQTVNGGIDIMAHTMERLFDGAEGVELMDAQGYAIVRSMIKLIPELRVNPENYEARAQYAWAASLGHNGSLSCGRGDKGDFSSHKLGHSLSLLFGIPHGATLAVMMPAWARYLYKENPTPFARFAEAVFGVEAGDEEERALEGIERLESFYRSIGASTTLRELKVGEADIERLARNAAAFAPFGVLKSLVADDILEIYKLAY
ncbi:MAG: iron-containing alcohol dehydrogenase [Synergistaceae bacterium]|jgi:alcohol dehydrogenase YqhD (iron-dependent ADH family)|nr:iron-containing alcohol dehydrogenase [Synergistaceae bacterium]